MLKNKAPQLPEDTLLFHTGRQQIFSARRRVLSENLSLAKSLDLYQRQYTKKKSQQTILCKSARSCSTKLRL